MKNLSLLAFLLFVSLLQCSSELDQSKILIKHCEKNLEIEQYLKQKNKNLQGCAQGTLVKTSSGYVPIEQLRYGDVILSVDGDQEIVDVRQASLEVMVCLQIKGGFVVVSKREQFFLEDGSLKSAVDLEVGDCLQGGGCVDTIFTIEGPCDCYGLTTEQHGYFIYPNIYVHNFDVAVLKAPTLLIGVLEIVNPVILFIGAIVPLSIYAVHYYMEHRSCDLQDVAVDDLHMAALQDVQSVQQTRIYYEQTRKELYNLYQDLVSIYNGLKLLLNANQNVLIFSNGWLSQFQVNPSNPLPLPNLFIECGYGVADKQKLLIIRDQELRNLEVKIIDLEVALVFHLNELIVRRDEALKELNLFIDEVNKQINMWNFDLYNISNDIAISNYEAHLKELELLNNLEQKAIEVAYMVAYYNRFKNNKIVGQATNIPMVIASQLKLIKSVNDRIVYLRSILFFNINIYENLLKERCLLSLQGINAVKRVVKKEIEAKDVAALLQAKKRKESMKDAQENLMQKNDKNSGGGGPDKDPDDEDPLPENNRSIMMHIFKKEEGHLIDTPENRNLLRNLVRDVKNYLGKDSAFRRDWYAKITKEGKQFWAWMKNGKIRDGGLNNKPLSWNAETGLCSLTIPKR